MNAIQKKRLLNVAKALRESKKPKKFTMGHYVWGDFISPDLVGPEAEFCGTPACALGHYGSRRDLQKLMKIDTQTNAIGKVQHVLVFASRPDAVVDFASEAVREHFGIDGYEASDLFSSTGCNGAKTPKAAAKFIEQFVKDRS